jgi:pseudouridine-5'-phosphate glycosidase
MTIDQLIIAPAVKAALAAKRPVVALESTIITHGMPYPANAGTAREVEAAVAAGGATPATIAIIEGALHVGLEPAELDALARDRTAAKASRRDLALYVAQGRTAGTTVAATMLVAARAGIAIFATGGIGGVHRGAESSFDISADLIELSRTPVAVVCAGAKSILDLPKTLEVLETYGVPVIGYRTDEFPAFFSRSSGLRLEHHVESATAAAEAIRTHRLLGMTGGMLICNPLDPDDEVPAAEMTPRIEAALADAAAKGIAGKDVTPYLLDRLVELTGGKSLEANRKLIRSNARLAGEIAAALQESGKPGPCGFLASR